MHLGGKRSSKREVRILNMREAHPARANIKAAIAAAAKREARPARANMTPVGACIRSPDVALERPSPI